MTKAKLDFATFFENTSKAELQAMIDKKDQLQALQRKRAQLEADLAGVTKQIEAIVASIQGTRTRAKTGAGKPKAGRKKKVSGARTRVDQPPVDLLIAEVLSEKKRALSVADLETALIREKGYKTQSKNFRNQLRVTLYRNQKKLFKKTFPGFFDLSPAGKRAQTARKPAAEKAAEAPARKAAAGKRAPRKKPAAKKNRRKPPAKRR